MLNTSEPEDLTFLENTGMQEFDLQNWYLDFLKPLRCCFCNHSLNLRQWWTERALYHKPGMLTVQTARYVKRHWKLCGNSSLSHKSRWMVRYHSMMLPMVCYFLNAVIWLDNAFSNICVNSFCNLPATQCWYLFDWEESILKLDWKTATFSDAASKLSPLT